MRVLSDIVDDPEPDFSIRESRVGDRYLLCSDGLSGVVSFETLQETLAASDPPGATCERLVALARRAGAPDNVTCIVADVVDEPASADAAPSVVGAASVRPQRRPPDEGSAAERAAALTAGAGQDEDADADADETRRDRAVALSSGSPASRSSPPCSPRAPSRLGTGSGSSTSWGSTASRSRCTAGCRRTWGRSDLATLDHTTGVLVDTLPPADQDSVRAGLVVDNGTEAAAKVEALRAGRLPREPGAWRRDAGSVSPGPRPRLAERLAPVSPTTVLRAQASPLATTGATPGPATPSSPLAAQPSPSGSPGAAALCRCPSAPLGRATRRGPGRTRRWRWRS